MNSIESDRIKVEYVAREKQQWGAVYSMLHRANQLTVHSIERALFNVLARAGWKELDACHFLDVGCGTGSMLLRWIQWRVPPQNCHGIELVQHRLEQARQRLPKAVELIDGDASRLPFRDGVFDFTSQFVVFSSILDDDMQHAVAREMLRVTKPDGIILSYDFWLNPTNQATRGVRLARLRKLFPGCKLYVQRITLAPPIARRLAPWSPWLCRVLESLKLFNSHYLVMIKPPPKS